MIRTASHDKDWATASVASIPNGASKPASANSRTPNPPKLMGASAMSLANGQAHIHTHIDALSPIAFARCIFSRIKAPCIPMAKRKLSVAVPGLDNSVFTAILKRFTTRVRRIGKRFMGIQPSTTMPVKAVINSTKAMTTKTWFMVFPARSGKKRLAIAVIVISATVSIMRSVILPSVTASSLPDFFTTIPARSTSPPTIEGRHKLANNPAA